MLLTCWLPWIGAKAFWSVLGVGYARQDMTLINLDPG